jgi:hypothetical protein
MMETYIPLWVGIVSCIIVWAVTSLLVHFTDSRLFWKYVRNSEETLRYHNFYAMKLENQIAELRNELEKERRRATDN